MLVEHIMFEFLMALCLFNEVACRQQTIINYAVRSAEIHNIDSNKFLELISCESRFDEQALGDYSTTTKKHRALGLLQWHEGSFNSYSKNYNIKGARGDSFTQIDLAVLVIRDGGIGNWYTCGKRTGLIKVRELALGW